VNGNALAAEARWVSSLGIGTVLLQHPASRGLAEAIANMKKASAIPPLVAVDEEGGEVQDLRDALGPIPSERWVAATMDTTAATAMIVDHARRMAELGIDVVFAPVVDVGPTSGGGPLGDRVFADDPAVVEKYGRIYVEAFAEAGLLPVLKHFPGHGSGKGNSDFGPVETPPIEELRTRDLLPYQALLKEPVAVMVGHLNVPGLSDTTPASLSGRAISGLLREELGFDGLVFSDSLSMGAIAENWAPEAAAVWAIAAGTDVALFATLDDPASVINALKIAVDDGTISHRRLDESVARVLAAKALDPCSL
jgi:beta-N-acetylhexosaminidase